MSADNPTPRYRLLLRYLMGIALLLLLAVLGGRFALNRAFFPSGFVYVKPQESDLAGVYEPDKKTRQSLLGPEFTGRKPTIVLFADGRCEFHDVPTRWLMNSQSTFGGDVAFMNSVGEWKIWQSHAWWAMSVKYADKDSRTRDVWFVIWKEADQFGLKGYGGQELLMKQRPSELH